MTQIGWPRQVFSLKIPSSRVNIALAEVHLKSAAHYEKKRTLGAISPTGVGTYINGKRGTSARRTRKWRKKLFTRGANVYSCGGVCATAPQDETRFWRRVEEKERERYGSVLMFGLWRGEHILPRAKFCKERKESSAAAALAVYILFIKRRLWALRGKD